MMVPKLSHTMDRMRRLGRLIEREARHPDASNLRLLRLKALFLKAQLRLARLVVPAHARPGPGPRSRRPSDASGPAWHLRE